jgi:hypothetical protein
LELLVIEQRTLRISLLKTGQFMPKVYLKLDRIKNIRIMVHLPVSAWNRLKSELLRWHETFEASSLSSFAD